MSFDRRSIVTAGLGLSGLGLAAGMARAANRETSPAAATDFATTAAAPGAQASGLVANADSDQSAALQALIDDAATRGAPLTLPPGRYRAARLELRTGTVLSGGGGTATLVLAAPGPLIVADKAAGLRLSGLVLDGGALAPGAGESALISLSDCPDADLAGLTLRDSGGRAIALDRCGGRIAGCRMRGARDAAIFALDSTGLSIVSNEIADCGDNGIQVWRREPGEDGTVVALNRIAGVSARSGGSGQNGNGINIYRAGNVLVEGNRIHDCAYSAVRGNAASNIQILSNNCQRIGEVALYAEFGFKGAIISGNLVDGAAAGISVTNFDVGGRLAVVQGNLIRNLKRREHEPVDKRGEGISVEADATVSGNTIEGAPTAGIVVGWGAYMRNVLVTGNVVRETGVGIMISSDPQAGACMVTANMISGTRDGAIRAMDKGRAHGPDLAREAIAESGRVTVSGNMAV